MPFRDLTEAYLLGDAAIGTAFAVGGALITLRVRRNAVGWLMLVAGSLYLAAAAVGSVLYLRLDAGELGGSTRVLAGVFTTIWFPAIALFIPLAMQLFPTGRPINRFWSAYLVVSVVGGICLTLSWVLGPDLYGGMGLGGPDTLLPDGPPGWLAAVLAVGTPLGRRDDRRCDCSPRWSAWSVGRARSACRCSGSPGRRSSSSSSICRAPSPRVHRRCRCSPSR